MYHNSNGKQHRKGIKMHCLLNKPNENMLIASSTVDIIKLFCFFIYLIILKYRNFSIFMLIAVFTTSYNHLLMLIVKVSQLNICWNISNTYIVNNKHRTVENVYIHIVTSTNQITCTCLYINRFSQVNWNTLWIFLCLLFKKNKPAATSDANVLFWSG